MATRKHLVIQTTALNILYLITTATIRLQTEIRKTLCCSLCKVSFTKRVEQFHYNMATKDTTDLFTTTSRLNFTNKTDNDTEMEVSISKDYVYAIYVKCTFISYTVMLILEFRDIF